MELWFDHVISLKRYLQEQADINETGVSTYLGEQGELVGKQVSVLRGKGSAGKALNTGNEGYQELYVDAFVENDDREVAYTELSNLLKILIIDTFVWAKTLAGYEVEISGIYPDDDSYSPYYGVRIHLRITRQFVLLRDMVDCT